MKFEVAPIHFLSDVFVKRRQQRERQKSNKFNNQG